MLYYYRTDASEGISIDKTSNSKECDVYHYSYFLDKAFKFQPYICNSCHDVLMIPMNLSDISISDINGVDYLRILSGISKIEAVNVLQKADLNKKGKHYKSYIYKYIQWNTKCPVSLANQFRAVADAFCP